MSTTTSLSTSRQVKVTLPLQVYLGIKTKAESLGLSLAAYLRHLAINEVKPDHYPTFKVTPQVEDAYRQAVSQKSQAEVVLDIDSYFDNL